MLQKSFLILLLSLCLTATGAFAYNPPVGIPNPNGYWGGFDPIEAANPTATTNAPGWFETTPRANNVAAGDAHDCYYIDNSATGATDSSNTYGYPGHPRLTIPNITYSAGAYIEIHGDGGTGAYRYTGTFNPHGVGTPTAPIWFVGVNKPLISARLDMGYSSAPQISYMMFDSLTWANGGKIDIRPRITANTIDHICVRNCTVIGTQTTTDASGISVGGSSYTNDADKPVSYLVFYNDDVGYMGDKNIPGEEGGIGSGGFYTNYNWILNCKIHDCAEDGTGGGAGVNQTADHLYIGRCQIYNNLTNAIDYKGVNHVVVSENTMWGQYDVWVPRTGGLLVVGVTYQWVNVSGSPDFSNVGAGSPPYTVGAKFQTTGSIPTSWGTATLDQHASSGAGEVAVFHYGGNSSGSKSWLNYPADVSFLFNTVYDGRYGVSTSSCGNFRMIGNVIYGAHAAPSDYTEQTYAVSLRGLKGDIWVTNNTIYGCDGGIKVPDNPISYNASTLYYKGYNASYSGKTYVVIDDNSDAGITGIAPSDGTHWKEIRMQIWGNVIAGRTQQTQPDIGFDGLEFPTNSVDMDYNLAYNATWGAAYTYGSGTIQDLTWMKANTTQQAHGLATNPLLVNPAGHGVVGADFTLQAGSPAIDASTEGTGTTAYASFLAAYGIPIAVDQAGAPRPAGQGWDMGAYEFAAPNSGVPSPPKDLRVGP